MSYSRTVALVLLAVHQPAAAVLSEKALLAKVGARGERWCGSWIRGMTSTVHTCVQGLVEGTQISSWSLGVGLREIIDRDLELLSETWTWRDSEIENHLSVSSDKDLALWSETCT